MSTLPVALRVKRRRDCAESIPGEIILETSSRPQDALAASLQHTLAVSQSSAGTSAAPEGPERKRCRFVLVPGHAAAAEAADVSTEAAEAGKQQGLADGPVLELWHTSGLSASASSAANRRPDPVSGQLQEDAAHAGGVYAAMVQQYLSEQQHQQHPAAAEPTQHRTYQRPTTRRHQHGSSTTQAGQQPSPAHQQHLPAYMTKGMLKQYGLWPAKQQAPQHGLSQQQQVGPAATTGRAGAVDTRVPPVATHAADADEDVSMDEEYTYDVYVAAEPGSSTAGQPHASTSPSSSQQGDGADLGAAGELPVIQVWEDELLQLHEDWTLGLQDSSTGVDSEDSNAEDYFANDYPDEDDHSLHGSSTEGEEAGDDEGTGRASAFGTAAGSIYGCYEKGVRRGRAAGAEAAGGYDSDGSFALEEYESSGEEQEGEREDVGPAWLRKHCAGYGGGDGGGQAWRSVLAQQFAPGPPR